MGDTSKFKLQALWGILPWGIRYWLGVKRKNPFDVLERKSSLQFWGQVSILQKIAPFNSNWYQSAINLPWVYPQNFSSVATLNFEIWHNRFLDFPGNWVTFQMTTAPIWTQLLSWNFVGILRVGIVYFGTNLSEMGKFFTKSILGPKIIDSIISLGRRKDFFFLPQINTSYPMVKYPIELGAWTYLYFPQLVKQWRVHRLYIRSNRNKCFGPSFGPVCHRNRFGWNS